MVQPLLKWVGNKRKTAKEIIQHFPTQFNDYYEPFVGSGAVLAELEEQSIALLPNFNNAYASDNNPYLIEIFNYVKTDPETLIEYYAKNIENYMDDKKKNYLIIRDRFNKNHNGLDFCLLSRTCYGGIIRFRKSDGYMSTPVGPHTPISPEKFAKRVKVWHELIKKVQFDVLDYKDSIRRAGEGDLIYCDPPYTHSQSILYGAQEFNIEELWVEIKNAKSRGAKVILSINGARKSNTEDISVTPPKGLFERIEDVDVGVSMVDRLQNKGQHMKKSRVTDKLMLTY